MNKYFLPIFRILTVIALVGFTSCSDDNDDIVPDISTDSYIGTAILTYLDGNDAQPKTENFTAILLTHKEGADKLSVDLHQQSQYYPQWYVKESLLQTTMSFTATETGAEAADGAHFNQSELNINYNYKNAVADENGRTLLSVKFCGQPNPQPVKNETDPIGTYTSVSYKYYELYCYQPEEFQYYSQLTDINEITNQWEEYEMEYQSISIEKSTKQNQLLLTTDQIFGLNSLDMRYTVNFDKNNIILKHQTSSINLSYKWTSSYSFTIEENDKLILFHTNTGYDELGQLGWPENAIGLITYSVTTFTKSGK
ncbi:MAG: hypothetical protein K2M94_03760 [Paramuribaculum sp.]|nr:hypothetical protein [Paramuribaculum sp.]